MSRTPGSLASSHQRLTRVPVATFVHETAEIAFALDDGGRVETVSAAFISRFGHRAEAVLRRRLTAIVHPDDVLDVTRAVDTARTGGCGDVRHRLRDAGGDYRWVESSLQGFRSPRAVSVLVVSRDVEDQVVRESRLVQEIAAWDDVVDQLREGVVVIDRAGLVVAANEAAARFLGTPREELTGSLARTQVVVVDEEGRPMPQERLPSTRAFRTGVPQHEPVQYRRRDGSSVWLLARAVPLWEPGQPAPGRVAIFLTDAAPADELPPPQGASALAAAAQRVLTPRETEVLRLLASGMDVRAISARLNITVHTARGHVKQVMQKLEARTQLQAVVIALRAGLIRLP